MEIDDQGLNELSENELLLKERCGFAGSLSGRSKF